ncbi:MAG: superinfection immunity protein [Alphaproteobacteria bacterium]|nr:superinfection immunity protein [Alphaproteobacteria bacterium]
MRAPGWFSLMALLILLLLFAFSVGVDVNSILILLIILVGSLLSIGFYFLPSLIASNRKHPDRRFIFIVNLFFGLTGIGWIGCLIWALSRDRI